MQMYQSNLLTHVRFVSNANCVSVFCKEQMWVKILIVKKIAKNYT